MAEEENTPKGGFVETSLDFRRQIMLDDLNDPIKLIERVYQLWWHWSDFHLHISNPVIEPISPPLVIKPEPLQGTDSSEHVYTILDYGNRLATSKSEDMFSAGMSMCKLYYTIEKMIALFIDRLQSGGVDKNTEVQVSFAGFELAQRKAFESIINLPYNVVVTNFEPGAWGDRFIETIKKISEKGYGYPPEAPRDVYKQVHGVTPSGLKR